MNKLTKRESDIMEILWKNENDMSANDILLASDGMSIYTIQQVLQRLLDYGFIEVASIGRNKKSLTRLYRPSVSEIAYYSAFMSPKTTSEFATQFIEKADDLKTLEQFKELIKKKEKELKGNEL
ncbi:MAG TPA: hypothetical protein DCP49_01240 [Erysipelotrichaceae bacterium]|nr:hypothetical protein [Erysipelotrichaceae bacterium]